jgi:hypothetical protein
MGNYVIAGVGNYVIVNPSNLGKYVIADTNAASARLRLPSRSSGGHPDGNEGVVDQRGKAHDANGYRL